MTISEHILLEIESSFSAELARKLSSYVKHKANAERACIIVRPHERTSDRVSVLEHEASKTRKLFLDRVKMIRVERGSGRYYYTPRLYRFLLLQSPWEQLLG